MKWKIGYKIVRNVCGRLYSWGAGGLVRSEATVTYEVGKVTVPNKSCGPLAVFSTMWDAVNFDRAFDVEVYRCKYVPSKRKYLYWRKKNFTFTAGKHDPLPHGTVTATRVELLEVVKRWPQLEGKS